MVSARRINEYETVDVVLGRCVLIATSIALFALARHVCFFFDL